MYSVKFEKYDHIIYLSFILLCSELLRFGFDAEAAGQDRRCKPPIWEDIISRAQTEAKTNEAVGNGINGDL